MIERLKPRRLLVPAVAVALAAVLVVIAAGTSGAVSPAPLPNGPPSVEINASAPPEISPRVAGVAVRTISSALRGDPGVASVTASPGAGRQTLITVVLRSHDVRDANGEIDRLGAEIDPGPLGLRYDAAALDLASAQASVEGDLGRLELLMAPLVLVALLGFMGWRGAILAALSGTVAVAASLIAIRASNGYLFAVAPAAAIGLAQAIELSSLFVGVVREEADVAPPGAPARALLAWIRPAAAATAVRGLMPLALLATGFHGAGSVALASAVAALGSFLAVCVFGGVTLAGTRPGATAPEGRLSRLARESPRWIARDGRRLAAALGLSLAATAALAWPGRRAVFDALAGGGGDGIRHGLGMAAILAGLGTAAALAVGRGGFARLRIAATAAHVPAPAAAAIGLLVWSAQDGHLDDALTGAHGAVYGGAVAVTAVAVVTIAAGRTVMAGVVTHREAKSVGAVGAAELAVRRTLPGAAVASLVVAASFGALAGAGLGIARETGVALAAGVVLDLILWRLPFLAFLARWGDGYSRPVSDDATAPQGLSNLPTLLGIQLGELGAEVARASMPVSAKVLQPFGVVHGGALSALAETVASYATTLAVRDEGMVAMGQASDASFLRPISSGSVHAIARARHRGRTTWVWDVEMTDDEGRLCALVRMTIAVRPK